jgi:phage terminase large subunit
MRDFMEILMNMGLYNENYHNKSNSEYLLNGNLVEFIGMDQPQKIRGRKRNLLFANEANELSKEDWRQLSLRTTERIILDYNPSEEFHWIYDEVIPREDCAFFQTTYQDNPFLESTVINEIERLKETDDVYWKIYGLGERAHSRSTIFQFNTVKNVPEDAELLGHGLDWGYTNDPTALLAVYKKDETLYLEELIYEAGMTNTEIVKRIKQLGITTPIHADSAEPKSIDEVRRYGINMHGAVKGKDSVNLGIDVMRRHKLFWTEGSSNGIREMRNYKWQEDRSGRLLNVPVDAHNHLIDAARYCITMRLMNPNYGKYMIG